MKNLIAFFFCLLAVSLSAQKIERYYDHNWKICELPQARFYSIMEKTDSGWLVNDYYIATNKLEMKGLYVDSSQKQKNGLFYWYHPNGFLKSSGLYKNGKRDGVWVGYHSNQYMSDSANYINGQIIGNAYKWYPEGYLSDSLSVDSFGRAVSVSWFSNGNIASAGRLDETGEKYGKWQFYYKQGGLSSSEIYDAGKLTQYKHYKGDGTIMEDTIVTPTSSSFAGGSPAWIKYLEKKLSANALTLKNTDRVTVLIQFEVDEEGNVIHAEVKVPVHPDFDKIALDVIVKSPRWIPAKAHNRFIRSGNTQSITLLANPFN